MKHDQERDGNSSLPPECCAKCVYAVRLIDKDGNPARNRAGWVALECHESPPKVFPAGMMEEPQVIAGGASRGAPQVMAMAFWPPVPPFAWCGSFEPRDGERELPGEKRPN